MKAMILAAGLGTRLRPITNDIPKALVHVNGVAMLEINIKKLIKAGCTDIIINVHHFADKVIDFLNSNDYFGINIAISDERDQLLDTGGGLKKATWFFDDDKPFILHNADVLVGTDLSKMYQHHIAENNLATLLVRDRPGSRFLLFNAENKLAGWTNTQTNEFKWPAGEVVGATKRAFSAVHIINPAIFKLMHEQGVFSVIDVYLRLCPEHGIGGYLDNNSYWLDIGTPEKLKMAEKLNL